MDIYKKAISFINTGVVLSSAYALWMLCMIIFNTEAPFVVVLTGSMEPSYHKGDILAVSNWEKYFVVGDIVVYRFDVNEIPIVHRVISEYVDKKGIQHLLTKGDNNDADDRTIYY